MRKQRLGLWLWVIGLAVYHLDLVLPAPRPAPQRQPVPYNRPIHFRPATAALCDATGESDDGAP